MRVTAPTTTGCNSTALPSRSTFSAAPAPTPNSQPTNNSSLAESRPRAPRLFARISGDAVELEKSVSGKCTDRGFLLMTAD